MTNRFLVAVPSAPQRSAMLICALLILVATAAVGEEKTTAWLPNAPTAAVGAALARVTGKAALFDRQTPIELATGELDLASASYATLLTVLRNNGLAAVHSGEALSIVPVEEVRQHALPDGDDAAAEDWVTRVIVLDHLPTATVIPILRPLMPAAGHLAAHPDANAVVIADRKANTERLERLMRQLDSAAARAADD